MAASMLLAVSSQAYAKSMDEAVEGLVQALSAEVNCAAGGDTLVGIFPFDEASLPLAPQNAFRLYEAFLGSLIDRAPSCVKFIDGRGAFVTLNYLGNSGVLRESGQQQRDQIQSSLASVDYTLDGTILESDRNLSAVFRLTTIASGIALSRESFSVPAAYSSAACGDGALPEEVALNRIATALLNRAGSVQQIVATGGKYAPTEMVTDAGRYFEERLIAQLSRSAENVLTGSALRVQRGAADDRPATLTMGMHKLLVYYWPCEGDQTARLSVTLRSYDGRDVTELTNINLSAMPSGMNLRHASNSSSTGELTVSPALASVGSEISLLAGPPAYCNPFFFSIAPSNKITPIPIGFFRQLDLGSGRIRYEISPQWNYGLVVQEEDEAGVNQLGYLCQPVALNGMAGLQGIMRSLLEMRLKQSEGLLQLPGMEPAYYQLVGFEIIL
jgi:hypothetical protein